jgi:hypothetical protein
VGNSSRRDAAALETAELDTAVAELRLAGKTYDEIATELGIHKTTALKSFRRTLARARPSNDLAVAARDAALRVCDQQAKRLTTLWAKLAPELNNKDPDPKIIIASTRLIETAMRIEERRAKILGTDAPVKQEFSGPDGGPIPLSSTHDELLARLARLAGEGRERPDHPEPEPRGG